MTSRFALAVASVLVLMGPAVFWSPRADTAVAQEPKQPSKPVAGADVFGHEKVWQFHFKLTASEYAAMQPAQVGFPGFPKGPNPLPKVEPKPGEPKRETHRSAFNTEFPIAEAAFTADGKTIDKVGLRYKGNSTYLTTARNLKRSLKVDLDKFADDARFHGLKSLTLNCGALDPTRTREAFAYSIYRAGGVPAPRTAFAEVLLTVPDKFDKEYVGVYTLVESVDKNFLKLNYKTDKGLLMKPERIRGLDYLGEDWAPYKANYQPKRDATPEEIKRTIAFTKLVNQGSEADFNKEIGNYLDIDAFLKYLALTAIISNLDSFFTLGHNYCLYLHPDTKKFHFIPWDVDLSLGNFALMGSADVQMDLSLTKPYAGESKLADRIMANKDFAAKYQTILKEVVPVCFAKEKLLKELATIETTIKPLMDKETKAVAARKENAGGGFGGPGFGGGFGAAPPDLRKFIDKRTESINAQLAGKSKGSVPAGFGFGPPPARPLPGDVLPPNVQNQLQMTAAQKKELEDLQKEVNARLEKILTPAQREQLKRMREGGFGFPPPGGGFPPKQ